MPAPPAATLIAFDFGARHIGLAVGQRITGTANPLTALRARDGVPDWPALDRIIETWQPHILVVGLPLNMDDSSSDMARAARRFARRLHGRYGLPVAMADERLTSFEARQRSGDPDRRHAIAAQLIAEQWLADAQEGDQRR